MIALMRSPLKTRAKHKAYEIVRLTDNCSLVILIWVEATVLFVGAKMVMGLLDHVVAVGYFTLLKSALVDVDVRVVFQIHFD